MKLWDYRPGNKGPTIDDYPNAGVILFNLPKLRQDQMPSKMLKFLYDNESRFEHKCIKVVEDTSWCLWFRDQDLLWLTTRGHVKRLDSRWNDLNPGGEVKDLKGIVHFAGVKARKPWNTQKSAAQKLWATYAAEAPFKKPEGVK